MPGPAQLILVAEQFLAALGPVSAKAPAHSQESDKGWAGLLSVVEIEFDEQ